MQKQDILISVIIPVYNTADCLERCVSSVRAQTHERLEILLVDDGSTDGSGMLCDRMAAEDARIRVFHKENGGSSSARNLGLREAGGGCIGFVDSDDFIDPRMYERMLEAMEGGASRIVQISRDETAADGSRLPDVCRPPEQAYFCGAQDFLRELLLHRGDCSFCTKLFPAGTLAGRQFPEGRLNEDFYLLVQLLTEAEGIQILPEQLYHVYYRIGSNTRKKEKGAFSRVFLDIVENADFVQRLTEEHFPALREEAARFGLYQRLDYLLHVPVEQMTGDNEFYRRVKRYLRSHVRETLTNRYLGRKQKCYLLLLTGAPKTVRKTHRLLIRARKR